MKVSSTPQPVFQKSTLYKMEDPELIHHFKGHKEGITALHFNPSRKQVMEIQILILRTQAFRHLMPVHIRITTQELENLLSENFVSSQVIALYFLLFTEY
jgi:hypothetical protein